ncbi:TolC family protein [Algoriphagus pacificus]|uniref:TolC family protein n=1 Tax=Algoriphagus pacificus TaxID=2811234 RepID=A0ABS3CHE8_9BACT|nr:TolC family protein [Algoriphagus pacificus]MBN7816514.1 TolC family protein [Algoriphagus pacificus]
MKLKFFTILLGFTGGLFVPGFSQSKLDLYIQDGLENNLVLKEKSISLDKSLLALKDARSYFLPAVEFGATYNLAQGGRSIDVPLGDLLNGVYSTLNMLTQSNAFPQLENQSTQFLPNNFYDARFRVTMPLINTDLNAQKDIRAKQVQMTEYNLKIYEAKLIEDIKIAYYNYCTAEKALEVIESSKDLVEQNLHDNESLLKNGKGLPASVLRAESEVENINALLIEAENRKKNASYYINFLLNRPLDEAVTYEEQSVDLAQLATLLTEDNLDSRPEILQIQTANAIQERLLQNNKNYWVPKLNTFVDLGSQAFDFEFNTQSSAYVFFGLNLNIPVFQGGRNKTQIQRGQLDLNKIQIQEELVTDQIQLELNLTKNEIRSNQAALRSSEKKLESSKAYLRLVDRGFKEGANSLIEFIDARNQYTQAALQQTIQSYDLLKSLATLERQLSIETY